MFMGKNIPKQWPKRLLKIIALLTGILTISIFSPADSNGIWNSHFFVAYADGSFARLLVESGKYRIGNEGIIFGEVKKANPSSRTWELYSSGEYFVSITPFGPILLIGDSSSRVRGWGWRF